jgi:carbon-monoxide dehydrogenase medium subunit
VDVATVLRGRSKKDTFAEARVALGAVAPNILRARGCEEALTNKPLNQEILKRAGSLAADDAKPIDDIRGSAQYRKDVVASLVFEALNHALHGKK